MKSHWGVLVLLTLAAACSRSEAPKPRAQVLPKSETPAADKAIAEEVADDPSWIAGTWKKEGDTRWLLFNLPADVAELAGNPPRVVRRGKLSMHGRFVSVIFDDGSSELVATPDHAALRGAPGVYQRGAPP